MSVSAAPMRRSLATPRAKTVLPSSAMVTSWSRIWVATAVLAAAASVPGPAGWTAMNASTAARRLPRA
ncbi:hypothetical protein OIE13_02275 [Streptosporangium sp. NBC_01810]|uniref:hypothetical protein n=1 Tax=Streptosporangium sp. NBC_01810 TaxID=2975951 RepID=UPI002DDA62D6|nr:hypothetical protein [Streptosporangium sp. NBC_01810]WSA26745.1 hypothetical protein OIE13_02275 [Streptosporangium sp. NBC_01810]